MKNERKHSKLTLTAGALAVVGTALFFWPPPQPKPPKLEDDAKVGEPAAPIAVDPKQFAALFDHSSLPAPVQPTVEMPKADPADALKRYAYLGGARAGERGAALFKSDGATLLLKTGDHLADFTLTDFSLTAATFSQSEVTVELPLASP